MEIEENTGPERFTAPEDRKQSGPGIASFVIALIALLSHIILATLGMSMIEPYLALANPEIALQSKELLESLTMLAAVFLVVVVVNIAGLALGLGASFSKIRKRTLGIIGTLLNGFMLIAILFLFLFVL